MMFYWITRRQSYSDPIVMLTSPGWMKVEWYHWFVSTTTEKKMKKNEFYVIKCVIL